MPYVADICRYKPVGRANEQDILLRFIEASHLDVSSKALYPAECPFPVVLLCHKYSRTICAQPYPFSFVLIYGIYGVAAKAGLIITVVQEVFHLIAVGPVSFFQQIQSVAFCTYPYPALAVCHERICRLPEEGDRSSTCLPRMPQVFLHPIPGSLVEGKRTV